MSSSNNPSDSNNPPESNNPYRERDDKDADDQSRRSQSPPKVSTKYSRTRPLRNPEICQGCRSRCGGGKCIRPVAGKGCRSCRRLGLVCVVDGNPVPACPVDVEGLRTYRGVYPGQCDQCKENARQCDSKRPCDHCVINKVVCTGSTYNCFWRGVGGDEMYGYYLTHGFGPTGVNDPNVPPPGQRWEMPEDYHLQFIEWAKERDYEITSRSSATADQVPKKRARKRSQQSQQPAQAEPPLELPLRPRQSQPPTRAILQPDGGGPEAPVGMQNLQLEYRHLLRLANDAMAMGVPANLAGIAPLLEIDLNNRIPINASPTARELRLYLARQSEFARRHDERSNPRFAEVPIDTSRVIGDVSDQALRNINPGTSEEHRNIAPLRNVVRIPLDRPPSPGPARPLYWIPWNTQDEDIDVPIRFSRLDPSNPEYVDRRVLRREPFADHPNVDGVSQLATIPHWRIWNNGDMFEKTYPCEAEHQYLGRCGKPTRSACEDTSHFQPIPICDDCEERSLREFRELFRRIEVDIRQNVCHMCADPDTILRKFANLGHRVWYTPPRDEDGKIRYDPNLPDAPEDLTAETIVSTALTERVGGWMGDPLEITGCGCAVKLFGRRLCRPHRLQYILNLQTEAARMRDYCKSVYGRMVCPLCRQIPGPDSYGFQGIRGGENNRFQAWACLICHGYVFNKKGNAPKGIVPVKYLGTVRYEYISRVPGAPYTVTTKPKPLDQDAIDPQEQQQEEESLWNRVLSLREFIDQPGDEDMDDIYD